MITESDRLELQDFLDGRLDDTSRREVERRLADSAEWRDELEVLTISREVSHTGLSSIHMPEGLRSQIQDAIADELQGAKATIRPAGRLLSFRLPAMAAAALILFAAGMYFSQSAPAAGPATTVVEIFHTYQIGEMPLQFTLADPSCLEDHLAAMGMSFDPGMATLEGYVYQGGCITKKPECDYATFAFVNEAKEVVTCQMFPGRLEKMTGTFEHRIQRGKDFMIAREGCITMTFWQDGDMICVISTDGNEEESIQLAVNKATHGGAAT